MERPMAETGKETTVSTTGTLRLHEHSRTPGERRGASAPIITPQSGVHRFLLLCGPVGSALFTATYLIAGATRPGYDAWRQPISALSLGPGGWVQVANFIVFGLFIACFAVGLRVALAPGVGATWGPLLEGVVALSLIVAGIFVQDPGHGYPPGVPATTPATIHGMIHLAATIVSFTARVIWCFVMARRFAQETHWRGWATYSIVSGILMLLFLNAFGLAMANNGPAGVFERLTMMVTSLVTILLATRLLTGMGRVSSAG